MMEIDWSKIDDHPTDAVRFFKIMMRLEYALKDAGFVRRQGRQNLIVLYRKFANERLGDDFFQKVKDSGNAETLFSRPPSSQGLDRNGHMKFGDSPHISNTQDLMDAVWRVRNNLFHGGKSGDPDHDRNDALIREAIFIVSEILQCDAQIRISFEGVY